MNITPLRTALLAGAALAVLLVSSNQASAAPFIGISIGTPPPPPHVERRWAPPYRGAVWIPGHYELSRGRYVWVGGYYGYPPRPGAYWVPERYHHGYYYPGHWVY